MLIKKQTYILSAMTVILTAMMSTFLTGCGEDGKIRNGENGTIADNKQTVTEMMTEMTTEISTDITEMMTENTTSVIVDEDITDNDMMDNNSNDNDRNDNNGVAGEIGDAIDNGISNIKDTLDGDENTEAVTEIVTETQD